MLVELGGGALHAHSALRASYSDFTNSSRSSLNPVCCAVQAASSVASVGEASVGTVANGTVGTGTAVGVQQETRSNHVAALALYRDCGVCMDKPVG